MKKIIVIGSCGAGKSTLSKKLQKILGHEIIHLDQLFWKAGWVESDKSDFYQRQKTALNKESWIADGNYGGTQELRMQYADTIIWLDFPTHICLWRILNRIWKYRGTVRPDMTKGCEERFDWEFLHYVLTFRWHGRKRILKMLSSKKAHQQLFHLKNDQAVAQFLMKLS